MKHTYVHLAFLVRISPAKRIDRAVNRRVDRGVAIKIAAKVVAADRAYCGDVIAPLLANASA
jgi:hypothetical protein